MSLLQHGVDRSVIALWLGHEQVETTQVYLHADMQLKEQARNRTASVNGHLKRYQPDDELLAVLGDSNYAEYLSATTRHSAHSAECL
jgi:integrase/recombinase XerD